MKSLLNLFKVPLDPDNQRAEIYRELIRREAKIGGQLFGPVPAGHRREFFCLDEQTWIWHEEWTDPATKHHRIVTTRYDIRPNGILKDQDGHGYHYIGLAEAQNLYQAMQVYNQRIDAELQLVA